MSTLQNGDMNNKSGRNNDGSSNDPSEIPPNYSLIENNNVNQQMWMAHIPSKLASVWNDAAEGTVLGTLTFTKGGGGISIQPKPTPQQQQARTLRGPSNSNQKSNSKHSLTVNIASDLCSKHPDLPPKYTIENISKKINGVLHPFTRTANPVDKNKSNNGGNPNNSNINVNSKPANEKKDSKPNPSTITLHGTVTTSCHFQIAREQSKLSSSLQGQQYRNLCKKRLMETNASKRVVQPVDSSELSLRRATATAVLTAGKGFGNAVQQHGKSLMEAREQSINGKKRKFDIAEGQSVRSVIFELFSSRRFWSVRELKTASGLLEKEIKPVLSEICFFHKKGDHRNLWELKSEYQIQIEGDDNAAGQGQSTK